MKEPKNRPQTCETDYAEKHVTDSGFRKNFYRIGRHINRFGKNILVTDHMDWSTDEIVRVGLDRYMVEKAFRQTKDHDPVSLFPIRHWTDGKIRCRILTCIVALTYLRIIELRVRAPASPSPPQPSCSKCKNSIPAYASLQSNKTKTPPHDRTTERHPGPTPDPFPFPGQRRRGLTNCLTATYCYYNIYKGFRLCNS